MPFFFFCLFRFFQEGWERGLGKSCRFKRQRIWALREWRLQQGSFRISYDVGQACFSKFFLLSFHHVHSKWLKFSFFSTTKHVNVVLNLWKAFLFRFRTPSWLPCAGGSATARIHTRGQKKRMQHNNLSKCKRMFGQDSCLRHWCAFAKTRLCKKFIRDKLYLFLCICFLPLLRVAEIIEKLEKYISTQRLTSNQYVVCFTWMYLSFSFYMAV